MLAEPESLELRGRLRGTVVFSSVLALVEVRRAVARHDPRDLPLAEAVLAETRLVAADERVLRRAAAVEPLTIRTLDAIHVASALALGDSLEVFVSYDGRQLEGAKAAGLVVTSPA